jgi:hypothetical protein
MNIRVKDIESQEETEINCCDKCFEFWGYKHPLLLLWVFVCSMFMMAVFISEFSK